MQSTDPNRTARHAHYTATRRALYARAQETLQGRADVQAFERAANEKRAKNVY